MLTQYDPTAASSIGMVDSKKLSEKLEGNWIFLSVLNCSSQRYSKIIEFDAVFLQAQT